MLITKKVFPYQNLDETQNKRNVTMYSNRSQRLRTLNKYQKYFTFDSSSKATKHQNRN